MYAKQKISELGNCIELVSIDPHFHNISVGLFRKGNLLTIFSFSNKESIDKRIKVIRDRCCLLGDLSPVENTNNQMLLETNINLDKPIKFMFTEAVEKNHEISPNAPIESPDTKTNLIFRITSDTSNNITNYIVSVKGENERNEMRIRAVVGGFIKYGGCERVNFNKFKFSDGKNYNKFVKLLLPYARNVSAVENMLSDSDSVGQMNTQTLGFSQT
tara:strand:+ start:533 stop:1180 length:648 start_codon:yes stop_codon:yes gene_type:complete